MGMSNERNQAKDLEKVPGKSGGLSGDWKVDVCVA